MGPIWNPHASHIVLDGLAHVRTMRKPRPNLCGPHIVSLCGPHVVTSGWPTWGTHGTHMVMFAGIDLTRARVAVSATFAMVGGGPK